MKKLLLILIVVVGFSCNDDKEPEDKRVSTTDSLQVKKDSSQPKVSQADTSSTIGYIQLMMDSVAAIRSRQAAYDSLGLVMVIDEGKSY